MKVGLLGFPFSDSNKGCEALTYSFVSVLEECLGESLEIVNFSGGRLGEVCKYFPNITFASTDFNKKNLFIPAIKELVKCDCVFDCTYGDNFSDIYNLDFVKRTTLFKEIVLRLGIPLVLAPQTVGPFLDKRIKKRAINVLKGSKVVFSRDILSTKYIKEISGIDAVTVTDLAFLLPFDKKAYKFNCDKKKIGLNVSGLLWKGGFSNSNQFGLRFDYKELTREIITWLKERDFEIHLIPHVIAIEGLDHDDDVYVCQELSKEYDVICAPAFSNPVSAKSYIANMDIFIGARMHSTVSAFSAGVPTIPISYSRKFEGLYNSLGYYAIINAREETLQSALALIKKYVIGNTHLEEDQKKALNVISSLEWDFKVSIKNLFIS